MIEQSSLFKWWKAKWSKNSKYQRLFNISNTASKKWKARAQTQESKDKEEPQVTTTSVHYQKHPREMLQSPQSVGCSPCSAWLGMGRTCLNRLPKLGVALALNVQWVKANIPGFVLHVVIFRLQEHHPVTQEDVTGSGLSFLKHRLLPARKGWTGIAGVVGSSDTAKVQQYFRSTLLFIQLLVTVFEFRAF